MKNNLYYYDSYKTEFPSEILRIGSDELGKYVLLSDSYFYPESGGQPSDLGKINDAVVTYIKEVDEDIHFYYSGELDVGPAICHIDWERRFDNMQQHTGQHILSAVFYDLLKGETSSFTIGDRASTIEMSIDSFDEKKALEIMKRSNEIVMKNIEIKSGIFSKSEAAKMPLRKVPSVDENIRIISIEPLDYSPCGGTHCRNTAEVGHIRISGWEKLKNSFKIYFVCGHRSLEDSLRNNLILKKCASALSSAQEDLPEAIDRIQQDTKAKNKEIEGLRKNLSLLESQRIFNESALNAGVISPKIIMGFKDKSFDDLKLLGQELSKLGSPLTILYLNDPSIPEDGQIKLVLNLPETSSENAGKLGKTLFEKFGGKGGGGAKAAQGSVARKFLPDFLQEADKL